MGPQGQGLLLQERFNMIVTDLKIRKTDQEMTLIRPSKHTTDAEIMRDFIGVTQGRQIQCSHVLRIHQGDDLQY
jgi:hypothetical protein